MAYQSRYEATSYLSTNDLSGASYPGPIFMKFDDSNPGQVIPCTASVNPEGVLENAPGAQMPASVSYWGITKIMVNGVYNAGQILMSSGSGVATAAGGTGQYARAIQLEASTAAGDIVACRLVDNMLGVSGLSGFSGISGTNGTSGFSGFSGT